MKIWQRFFAWWKQWNEPTDRARAVLAALSDYTDWRQDSLFDWLIRHKSGLTLCVDLSVVHDGLHYSPGSHEGGPPYTAAETRMILPEDIRVLRRLQEAQIERQTQKLLATP